MNLSVERSNFDPLHGFQYYISFKPNCALAEAGDEIYTRIVVPAIAWLSENSELAELTFEVPKQCRNSQALKFMCRQNAADYIAPRAFLTIPGPSGDAVIDAAAELDLDFAGRIVGIEVQWSPERLSMPLLHVAAPDCIV